MGKQSPLILFVIFSAIQIAEPWEESLNLCLFKPVEAQRGKQVWWMIHPSVLGHNSQQPTANSVRYADRGWNFSFKGTIPDHSDFLLAYSTVNHYVSYRNELDGSRFVRCLVEVFQEKAGHEDVLSMLIMVNDKLSKMGEIGKKQIGQPTTTLTKKLFLWPGWCKEALSWRDEALIYMDCKPRSAHLLCLTFTIILQFSLYKCCDLNFPRLLRCMLVSANVVALNIIIFLGS